MMIDELRVLQALVAKQAVLLEEQIVKCADHTAYDQEEMQFILSLT